MLLIQFVYWFQVLPKTDRRGITLHQDKTQSQTHTVARTNECLNAQTVEIMGHSHEHNSYLSLKVSFPWGKDKYT